MNGTRGASIAAQTILAGICKALGEKPTKEHVEILIPAFAEIIDRETAAPELLEALNGLLDCISETRGKDATDAVVKARAVKAKAEGKQ